MQLMNRRIFRKEVTMTLDQIRDTLHISDATIIFHLMETTCPNVVIHCDNDDEKTTLWHLLAEAGYVRPCVSYDDLDHFIIRNYFSVTILDTGEKTWIHIIHPTSTNHTIISFSNLFSSDIRLPAPAENELSAKELMQAITKICNSHRCCRDCELYDFCQNDATFHPLEQLFTRKPDKIDELLAIVQALKNNIPKG